MKKIFYIFFIWNFTVSAQDKLSDIQYSSTPAATIIGMQNKELNTAHSYEVLYTELISPIISTENNIPTNINLEFAPYFLKSRDITEGELSEFSNIPKRIKISVASTSITTDTESSFSRAGFGLRFNILQPKYTELSSFNELLTIINRLEATGDIPNEELFPEGKLDFNELFKGVNDKKIKEKVIALYNTIRTDRAEDRVILKEKLNEYQKSYKFEKSEYGFSMDVAGAFTLDFPKNTIGYSRVDRWGAWLNAGYKDKEGALAIAGMGRFSNYSFDTNTIFENGLFVDFGINISMDIDKFKLSAEYIGKTAISDVKLINTTTDLKEVTEHKWDASISYQITNNYLISLSYSEAKGNSDYFNEKVNQLLVGLSAAIFNFKQ